MGFLAGCYAGVTFGFYHAVLGRVLIMQYCGLAKENADYNTKHELNAGRQMLLKADNSLKCCSCTYLEHHLYCSYQWCLEVCDNFKHTALFKS